MKTLLLTGSGGFIGKNLKDYLKDSYTLLTPRSSELNLCDSSAVETYFKNNAIDFIVHCGSIGGARGLEDKDTTIEANLAMVDNLIASKKNSARMIVFGSGAMYDKSSNLHKVRESEIGNVKPYDLYGQSKVLISEKIKKRNDTICLNIFACYGYGEKETRFPSYAISQNLKRESIEINRNVVFDYLFVEDMQKIVEYFIENESKDNIMNITPTKSISLVEIAQLVNEIGTHKSEIIVKNPILANEYTGDNTLLLKNFPAMQFVEMKTGLEKLYRYIESQMALKVT